MESAFQVEILDAPYPILKAIAEELMHVFKQREVILKNYETGEIKHLHAYPSNHP
jgi:hypothetical protein